MSSPVRRRCALLLTDVVDSTKLAESLGDTAAAALWARHDRVARDLLPAHAGREIDKTDGLLLMFGTAAEAVAYAVAYHRALRPLGLTARAGVHVGDVLLTSNAPEDVALGAKPLEVDGIAKPTAARVMSVASGGQTLVTAEVVAGLEGAPLRVVSHGRWQMKGVAEPVELFEVGDDDAPFAPPPDGAKVYRVTRRGDLWLPAREIPHALPAERDAFVGRAGDLRLLADRVEEARLVSLLGPGGTGKTRLAVRFGWTWLGDWPGGVWFCDLTETRSAADVVAAVARALDVPPASGDPVAQLGHALAGRGRCLVILDNFEQVAPYASATVGRWLDRAVDARFIVTTREVLGLPGEVAMALAPLVDADAVALFVARAEQAKRGFVLSEEERPAVEALVALLDALPLAIELAAARVRVMPPATLLKRMDERFKLLASAGGRPSRQATLRGAIDWSWELLSPDERSALAQVSVFEGGFSLDAVEAVLALEALWPMDAVQALVDKSLVRTLGDDRFGLLTSIQAYAAERLDGSDARAGAEERHGAWFASLPEDLERGALARELDNLSAACLRAARRGDVSTALATLGAVARAVAWRGPYARSAALAEAVARMPGLAGSDRAEAQRRLGEALRAAARGPEAEAPLRAALEEARALGDRALESQALLALGGWARESGRPGEARPLLEAALAGFRELGDRRREGSARTALGLHAWVVGRLDEGRAELEASLAIARGSGDLAAEGNMLVNLGILDVSQGRRAEAIERFEAGLAAHRAVGNRLSEANTLVNLGVVSRELGRTEEALSRYEEALPIYRAIGARAAEAPLLANLGIALRELGRPGARDAYERSLAISREVGDRRIEGIALSNLGALLVQEGQLDTARGVFLEAVEVHRAVGNRAAEGSTHGSLARVATDSGQLEVARGHVDEGERLLREVGDPVELAALLVRRVELARREGREPEASAALAEARALAAASEAGPDTELGRLLAGVAST